MSVLGSILLYLFGNNLHRKILKVVVDVMSEQMRNAFSDLPATENDVTTSVQLECTVTKKDGATLRNPLSIDNSDRGNRTCTKLVSTDKDTITHIKGDSTGNGESTCVTCSPTYLKNSEITPTNLISPHTNKDSITTLVKLDSTDDKKYTTHDKLESSLEENKNKSVDDSKDDKENDIMTKPLNNKNIEQYEYDDIFNIGTSIGTYEGSSIEDDLELYLGPSPFDDDIPLTWPNVPSSDLYSFADNTLDSDDTLLPTTDSSIDYFIHPKEEIRLEDSGRVNASPQDNISQQAVPIKCEATSPTTIVANKEVFLKRPIHQDEDGDTMLHILIAKNDGENCLLCIPQCIGGHKGLDTVNNMGQTALHMACYTQNIDVTKCLLENGAKPCLLDAEGNSCLHIACEHNNYELVECILTCLHSLKQSRTKDIINVTNTKGLAPVHIATMKENTNIILILHEYGANMDKQDDCSGKTPLIFAVESLHVKSVQMLIDRLHADINIRNFSDFSPLHFAAQANSAEIVKILLDNGAEVGTKTVNLKTEKDLATDNDVKVLIERYLRKNRRQKLKETPTYDQE